MIWWTGFILAKIPRTGYQSTNGMKDTLCIRDR